MHIILLTSVTSMNSLVESFLGGERGEGSEERETDLLFHLFRHLLVDPLCALTGDQTCKLGTSE